MNTSEDHVINMYYKLPSIFYETKIAKTWWELVINKIDIISEYVKFRPDKEHLKFQVKDGDLYNIYLFYIHCYS